MYGTPAQLSAAQMAYDNRTEPESVSDDEYHLENLDAAAHDAALEAFLGAVEVGTDINLPDTYAQDRMWPVSTYMAECGMDARALLFKACYEALRAVHPNVASEHNLQIAEALRAFVNAAASEYANEHQKAHKS